MKDPPCLTCSTLSSGKKVRRARERASRSAPDWAEWPPPLTLASTSKRPNMFTKCRGNTNCSLIWRERERGREREGEREKEKERENTNEYLLTQS